jgi:hypothetical protein
MEGGPAIGLGIRSRDDRQTTSGPIEVIGVDHIYLAVSNIERVEAFYDIVLRPNFR